MTRLEMPVRFEQTFRADPWRRAIGRIPTGVCVLTTAARSARHGMTCGTFAVVSFDPPVFREALASIECRVSDRLRKGDHTLVIADVSAALVGVGAAPLVHFRGGLLEASMARCPEAEGRAAYEDI
ncbi:MAG: flavin reductase [Ilumatobacteraceae bacterium]